MLVAMPGERKKAPTGVSATGRWPLLCGSQTSMRELPISFNLLGVGVE